MSNLTNIFLINNSSNLITSLNLAKMTKRVGTPVAFVPLTSGSSTDPETSCLEIWAAYKDFCNKAGIDLADNLPVFAGRFSSGTAAKLHEYLPKGSIFFMESFTINGSLEIVTL